MVDIGKHFSSQHEEYLNSVFGANKTLYANINKALTPCLGKDILDVGNGGVFTYDITKLDKVIAVDIAFENISKLKKFANVSYKCDDARSLKSISSKSFDTVIYQFALHHITGKSSKETLENIEKVIVSAMRVLKPGGKIIIVENVVPNMMELAEKLFYKAVTGILRLFKKPMVYLFSVKTILKFIQEGGFMNIDSKEIFYGKRVDILLGTKPGLLIVPAWMSPHRCCFFIAKKPDDDTQF